MVQAVLKTFLSKHHPSRVLLLGHSHADVDAMASAIALFFSIPSKHHPVIGVPDHCNRDALGLLQHFSLSCTVNPVPNEFDAVILLDCHAPERLGTVGAALQSFSKPLLVLDHHSLSKTAFKTSFRVLDPNASSTAVMVLNALQSSGFKLSKNALTALAAGMVSDSVDLQQADAVLLEQVAFCLQSINLTVAELKSLYASPMDASEKIAMLKALHRLRLFDINGFLVAVSENSFFASSAANALLVSGADLALVAGVEKKSALCHLAVRSTAGFVQKTGLHAATDVCMKLPDFFGGHGNGHQGAARFVAAHAEPEKVLHSSLELVQDFFRSKGETVKTREII